MVCASMTRTNDTLVRFGKWGWPSISAPRASQSGGKLSTKTAHWGLTHAELSAEALAQWNLPEEIQTAVRYHGSPESDPTPLEPGQITLSRVLNAADRYVKGTGVFVSLFESPSEEPEAALEQLGLGERLPVILGEFDSEFTAIKAYF